MKLSAKTIRALKATVELCGSTFSEEAAEIFLEDITGYPEHQLIGALARCRREVRGRLTPKDVIDRLEDGRPTPDEAWAQVPKSERDSVVWTNEMAHAWSIAAPAWFDGDRMGAARAFREAYIRAVSSSRDRRIQPEWTVSLGDDRHQAYNVIEAAVRDRKISIEAGLHAIPDLSSLDTFQALKLAHEPASVPAMLPNNVQKVQKLVATAVGGRR